MQPKTLVGKNNYLFLQNDTSNELDIHCNGICNISQNTFAKYTFENFYLVVFPDKSIMLKQYLPDNMNAIHRPSIDIYNKHFNIKMFDAYDILSKYHDIYYKTDTHINLKGNYIIYRNFIKRINHIYNIDLKIKEALLYYFTCSDLNKLNQGIGDLTWERNLGDIILTNKCDNFYFSPDIKPFYLKYKILDNEFTFYNYNMVNITSSLLNTVIDWNIISNYIIYKKNDNMKYNVIIFYDSFLLNILSLYLEQFYEIYLIKSNYNNTIIDSIRKLMNIDYIFEFRVERFLK